MQFMIDAETLGNSTRSPILTVGIVAFDDEKIYNTLSVKFNPDDMIGTGMNVVQWDVIKFWMSQGKDAISALPGKDADDTIGGVEKIIEFFSKYKIDEVWSHGAAYDIPLMQELLTILNIRIPWDFWNVRCTRTFDMVCNKLLGLDIERTQPKVKHDALEDAIAQTIWVQSMFKKMRMLNKVVTKLKEKENAS